MAPRKARVRVKIQEKPRLGFVAKGRMDKNEYLQLIETIVATELPEEMTSFRLAKDRIAETMFSGGAIEPQASTRDADFGFIDSVKPVLEFVALMVGTFETLTKIIDWYKKSRKPIAEAELAPLWNAELRRAGLSVEVAEKIVRGFQT